MTLDTLVLEREDSADYTLRFKPGSVAVEYLGIEISDYLRRGFVPQDHEGLEAVESRIASAEKYLQSRPNLIPRGVKEHFEKRYGSKVCDYVWTSWEPKMEGAAASFAPERGGTGRILIPPPSSLSNGNNAGNALFGITYGDTGEGTWEHELIHAMMREGPEILKMEKLGYAVLDKMDRFYLPLPYSPLDKAISFTESAPLAFLPEQQELVDAYAKSSLEWMIPWGVMSLLSTSALALSVGGPLASLPAAYWLASTGVRIPRVRRLKKLMGKDIGQMDSLRERLGDAEALKLLAFMDPETLEKTVDFIGENDIRFSP